MHALQKSGVPLRHQQQSVGVKNIATVSDACTPRVRSVIETPTTASWCQKHRKSQQCMRQQQASAGVKSMVSSVLQVQESMWAIGKRLHGKEERCSKLEFSKNILSCFSCMCMCT